MLKPLEEKEPGACYLASSLPEVPAAMQRNAVSFMRSYALWMVAQEARKTTNSKRWVFRQTRWML
jgi:hypothetical protein